MGKTLCEIDKRNRKKLMKKSGNFHCASCERKVNKKKWICKPVKN